MIRALLSLAGALVVGGLVRELRRADREGEELAASYEAWIARIGGRRSDCSDAEQSPERDGWGR